jgi:hypothetical protein
MCLARFLKINIHGGEVSLTDMVFDSSQQNIYIYILRIYVFPYSILFFCLLLRKIWSVTILPTCLSRMVKCKCLGTSTKRARLSSVRSIWLMHTGELVPLGILRKLEKKWSVRLWLCLIAVLDTSILA